LGSLYQRKGSPFYYWSKYYDRGRPVRETTGTTKEKEAVRILRQRGGRVAAGETLRMSLAEGAFRKSLTPEQMRAQVLGPGRWGWRDGGDGPFSGSIHRVGAGTHGGHPRRRCRMDAA
jgi:hypothetical protein